MQGNKKAAAMQIPLVITHNGGGHMNCYLPGTPTMAKVHATAADN
jgi:hypothetical protein